MCERTCWKDVSDGVSHRIQFGNDQFPILDKRNLFLCAVRKFCPLVLRGSLSSSMLQPRSIQSVNLTRFARTLATHASTVNSPVTRHTWAKQEIQQIYDSPLLDLVFRAAAVHRQHHDPNKIQLCTLMNIKSAPITSIT